jgi:chemotaxis protein MotB
MARRKKAGKENSERWLLTYADLITLLMVFFVLLFAMSHTDTQKFQALAASLRNAFNVSSSTGSQPSVVVSSNGSSTSVIEQQDFQRILQAIQQAEAAQNIPSSQVSAQITNEGISVTVSGTLLFFNGTNQIKPDGLVLLQKIGAILTTIPNAVRVEGYTDNIPVDSSQYPTNWELSAARAVAVVRYLSEGSGVAPQRLSAVGCGQYHPIVPNDTRAHREENRRAVIVVLYGSGAGTDASSTATP